MFSPRHEAVLADLSTDLSDEIDWKVGSLRVFDFPLNIAALAVEPVAGLLAAGTANGTIYIFGGPSVESKIILPEPVGVQLLQFSSSTYFLLCLDDYNQLHVYNLLEFGRPRPVTSVRFDQTNSITLSPSHAHVFLAMQAGEVRTFDLACLRKSPYTMPNMWKLYEESMVVSGVPSLAPPSPSNVIDTVIHPRNLNLLFVAYSNGIILTDLTERSTVRAYELILPPGAPGGAGYGSGDILTHRRMIVTSIAVHPSGHSFACGYVDGSIGFWAVEDDKQPLLVRTLDTADVNIVNSTKLEEYMDGKSISNAPQSLREPIFKLSWSGLSNSADPRGGETVLTIFGGLDSGMPPGVTVYALPAFNPSEPPADQPATAGMLHPAFRQAMCQSVSPKKLFFYETRGLVQDYLLIPRANPHLGGTFDPYAILFILEIDGSRMVEAFQFPPPGFVPTTEPPKATGAAEPVKNEDQDDEAWAAGLLKSPAPPTPLPKSPRHLNHAPYILRTPFTLSNGGSGVQGGSLFKLDNDIHDDFVDKKNTPDLHLNLEGGQAFADTSRLNELKLSKYQSHRILVTYSRDMSVRFYDLSAQLLIPAGNSPLQEDWPKPLTGLSIRLEDAFDDASFVDNLSAPLEQLSIASVQVAAEALECAVALNSGEVLVYHSASTKSTGSSLDKSIILLDHIQPRLGSRLKPYFLLSAGKGPVETFALSDIGFLAVSYCDGSLIVVDMRGPMVILSLGRNKKPNRHSIKSTIHVPGSPTSPTAELITSLKWTVCPLEKDPQLRVRLIATRQSGHAEIYTLLCSGNPVTWSITGEPTTFKSVPDPLPDATFVLDTKSGAQWRADRAKLAASFKGEIPTATGGKPEVRCVLLSVGAKGARVFASINGEKVAKVDWGHKHGIALSAQVVERMGSHALIVQTDRHDAIAYTLPHLEHIITLQLPPAQASMALTIEETGDFIAWTPTQGQGNNSHQIHQANYSTFFDIRRVYTLPDIDLASTRGTIPPQPQPVSLGPASYLGSWFSFNQTKSGAQIDELLGGPDRPLPERVAQEKGKALEEGAPGAQGGAAGLAAGAAAVQANIYNRLTSAMSERGQLLGDLEERFNSLEEGSKSMVAQAKRLATQQTAKSWFGF